MASLSWRDRRIALPVLAVAVVASATLSVVRWHGSSPTATPGRPPATGGVGASVYVGEIFGSAPHPWAGGANVTYQGDAGASDNAAIRLDAPIAVSVSGLTLSVASSSTSTPTTVSVSGTQVVPAGGSLIYSYIAWDFDDTLTTCTAGSISMLVNGAGYSHTFTSAEAGAMCSDNSQWLQLPGSTAPTVQTTQANPTSGPSGSMTYGGVNGALSAAPQNCVAQPVNCATGNMTEAATDIAIPGRGRSLSLTRTYNALAAATETAPDALGWGWTDSYAMTLSVDPTTSVVTIAQQNGSTVSFTPSGGGYSTPPWVTASLTKNADGSYTFTLKDQTSDLFNASGQLLSETDRNGYITALAYSGGQLATVTDPAGRALTFSYDGSGRLSRVTDPVGRFVQYGYDASGNLESVQDMNGATTNYGYDSLHRLSTVTDPNGHQTTTYYDTSNRAYKQVDPMGRTTTLSWSGGTTTITDPLNNVTTETYVFDELVSITRGAGTTSAATVQYGYDAGDNRNWVKDANGNVSSATFDSQGNLTAVSDALGRTITLTYDAMNDVSSVTDPAGVITTYLYDSHGNLTAIARPLTSAAVTLTTTYEYQDAAHPGDVTTVVDPMLRETQIAYDANGDQQSITDPAGSTTTMAYDTVGRMGSMTLPLGNVIGADPTQHQSKYTYDNEGRLLSQTDPMGNLTKVSYDAAGNLATSTDALGKVTKYGFDPDNELTLVTRPDGSTSGTGYDHDGAINSQTDGNGNITTYKNDPLGRPILVTDPLGRQQQYRYDGNGNAVSVVDAASQTTTMTYDAGNELTFVSYSDPKTPNVTYTYDANGHRSSMTDGTGTTSYAWDSMGRLVSVTDGAGRSTQYGYDFAGNLNTLVYPAPTVSASSGGVSGSAGINGLGTADGHPVVTRISDADGRLTSVSDWLNHTTTFTYDADGNLKSEAYANGTTAAWTYDRADQVTGTTDTTPQGVTFLSEQYGRDANARVASDNLAGVATPVNQTYSYDLVGRLTGSSVPAGSVGVAAMGYGYDPANNLTQISVAAASTTQQFDSADQLVTRLSPAGTKSTYSYDPKGNRVQALAPGGATSTYTYDAGNRMTGYAGPAVNAVNGETGQNVQLSYTYDGDGLRQSKISSTVESFAYDRAEGLPLIIEDGTTDYVTGPGGLPLEQVTIAGTVLYYHHDQLGSTRALTDQSGRVVATYAYDPYGNALGTPPAVVNPFQFAGQYKDVESGLLYLRSRYYDPTTGQFLAQDPMKMATRIPYGYAQDDPLNGVDPSGLWCSALGPYFDRESVGNIGYYPVYCNAPRIPRVGDAYVICNPDGTCDRYRFFGTDVLGFELLSCDVTHFRPVDPPSAVHPLPGAHLANAPALYPWQVSPPLITLGTSFAPPGCNVQGCDAPFFPYSAPEPEHVEQDDPIERLLQALESLGRL